MWGIFAIIILGMATEAGRASAQGLYDILPMGTASTITIALDGRETSYQRYDPPAKPPVLENTLEQWLDQTLRTVDPEHIGDAQGMMIAEMMISTTGRITYLEMIDGHPALDQPCIKALKNLRFHPARTADDERTECVMLIPIWHQRFASREQNVKKLPELYTPAHLLQKQIAAAFPEQELERAGRMAVGLLISKTGVVEQVRGVMCPPQYQDRLPQIYQSLEYKPAKNMNGDPMECWILLQLGK